MADGGASGVKALIQPVGNRGDMGLEARLGEKGRGNQCFHHPAPRKTAQQEGDGEGDRGDNGQHEGEGQHTLEAPVTGMIEALIEEVDEAADPLDRMADTVLQEPRIAAPAVRSAGPRKRW